MPKGSHLGVETVSVCAFIDGGSFTQTSKHDGHFAEGASCSCITGSRNVWDINNVYWDDDDGIN